MKQQKLMILGASTAQLPLIFKAKEMGLYIITVDNIPSNVGHQFSDQSVDCSTVDHKEVLKIAQQLGIDGIVTFASDIATSTVAFVGTALQLKTCTLKSAETLSNKANFREFQYRNSLNCPEFLICDNVADLTQHYSHFTTPLIFKPVDTSGSRGIKKIETPDLSSYIEAFHYAQSFSRSGKVSIEQFVEGIDVSGDGFLVNGQLFSLVSKKYKQGFIPKGHSFPTDITEDDQARIFEEVANTCQVLGYQKGPIDFDVKISDSLVTIIEMSPRLGGNGIPELIRQSAGIDLIEMTLHYALGEMSTLPKKPTHLNPCGSLIFGSDNAGLIESYLSTKEIRKKLPELVDCYFNYLIGEQVPAFEHSGNSLGYAIFDYSLEKDYKTMVKQIQAAMALRVKPINSLPNK